MLNVFLVAGARPNFMKIAPIFRESLNHEQVKCQIVHTGQHYDYDMSQTFFSDCGLPEPDYFFNAGSGSHASQTAKIMKTFEELCINKRPDIVIVVGDVNSTLACSIVAKKEMIRVAHVEAGLRSGDMTMPEEINRIVTDAICDYFFVTEESAIINLSKEGKDKSKIQFVGNVMIDNLYFQLDKLQNGNHIDFPSSKLKQQHKNYAFLTLHRPSNVDSKNNLYNIINALNVIAKEQPIFFPIHPRTQKMVEKFKLKISSNIIILPPLGFMESLNLWKDAAIVITDSGGLQEETTALGVSCLTVRENTERPITVDLGTNVLAGTKKETILRAYGQKIKQKDRDHAHAIPPKWDGKASKRIWQYILAQ